MSLELALQENTNAVKALTEMLAKAGLIAANAAVSTCSSSCKTETKPAAEKVEAKKQKAETTVATASADTATTAETPAVQEKKAETSEPASVDTTTASAHPALSKEERSVVMKNVMAKAGREAVVGLLAKFGATKAGDIEESRLGEFDAELAKLAA